MQYVPHVHAAKAYPVRDSFFKPLSLSEPLVASLRAEAASAVKKALAKCREYQHDRASYMARRPHWKLRAEHHGLYEYKRSYMRNPNMKGSRILGKIEGNYLDVARFFKSETRAEYFNVQKTLFPCVIDAAVLHTISRSDSPFSYEGIKWAAYDPFLLRFRMDSCHYETMGEGIDLDGNPYVCLVILSVDLPEVPDLTKTKRTVRMSVGSIMIIRPSDRDRRESEIFLSIQGDFKGHRIPRGLFKHLLVGLHSLGSSWKTRKAVYKLTDNKWVATRVARQDGCSVCSKPFSMLRYKGECSSCLSSVCRKCLVKRPEVADGLSSHNKTSSASLCKTCFVERRHRDENETLTPMLGDHSPIFIESEPCVWFGRRSSFEEWMSSPASSITKKRVSRGRLATATSIEDELLCNGDSWASSSSGLDLSFRLSSAVDSVIDEPDALMASSLDDEIILEDDQEPHSARSVDFTVDTSEMERVRRGGASSLPVSAASSSELFESIHLSLQEQSNLLRELRKHSVVGRNHY